MNKKKVNYKQPQRYVIDTATNGFVDIIILTYRKIKTPLDAVGLSSGATCLSIILIQSLFHRQTGWMIKGEGGNEKRESVSI